VSTPEQIDRSSQAASGGASNEEILEEALREAQPRLGLSWLDIGCGTGDLLRRIRMEWEPGRLVGVDPLPWLAADLIEDVEFHQVGAEQIDSLPAVDRVMLVETIEHLEAPWTVLRAAARLVAPGGRIVVSTPNVANLRHRLELALEGQLTNFRPGYEPHLTPALPHVTSRILQEEGLVPDSPCFAGADVIPGAGGRCWPEAARGRWPRLLSVSVFVSAARPA
jgi:SAM-dependent methyltransferase